MTISISLPTEACRLHQGHAQVFLQRGGVHARADVADHFAIGHDGIAFARHTFFDHFKADGDPPGFFQLLLEQGIPSGKGFV
jgi:hypothetical protein